MRKPFVLRVQADDPAVSRGIARALVIPLQERGARVLLDGASQGGGSSFGVHVITAASAPSEDQAAPDRVVTGTRGMPGATLRIGVWDENDGARWLAPLDVPSEPAAAAQAALEFLERWGFIASSRPVKPTT